MAKVPMHRARTGGGNAARTVSRPGVNGDSNASTFQSPYQPPPATGDLAGDVFGMDPNAWQLVHVADHFWRLRMATPAALATLAAIMDSTGGARIQAINAFLVQHMHPEDLQYMLERLADPDDEGFGGTEYNELYRCAVTVGTARPFWQSSASLGRQPMGGALCVPSWHSAAWDGRSSH